jgi:hypothetical protein
MDPTYLNKMYSFWSNLFFGGDDKTESATGSKKPADVSKPEEAKPTGPAAAASSYSEGLKTNAGAAGFNPGAALFYGNSNEALAKHSMQFKAINFMTAFFAGFLNLFKGQGNQIADPPAYTNYAMDCKTASIPPENIELRHRPVLRRPTTGCIQTTSYSTPKAKAPEEPECRAAYIPFEAIEYRYGHANDMMHLPICMNK